VEGETKHLIVLLGVPIAYPRLVWLENVLTSRLMDPVKALGRAGMLGGFLNQFDGGVEILDDLDDHWTAKNHKAERNWFIEELQELSAEKSVRVTILGFVMAVAWCIPLADFTDYTAVMCTLQPLANSTRILSLRSPKIEITDTCPTSYLRRSSIPLHQS